MGDTNLGCPPWSCADCIDLLCLGIKDVCSTYALKCIGSLQPRSKHCSQPQAHWFCWYWASGHLSSPREEALCRSLRGVCLFGQNRIQSAVWLSGRGKQLWVTNTDLSADIRAPELCEHAASSGERAFHLWKSLCLSCLLTVVWINLTPQNLKDAQQSFCCSGAQSQPYHA